MRPPLYCPFSFLVPDRPLPSWKINVLFYISLPWLLLVPLPFIPFIPFYRWLPFLLRTDSALVHSSSLCLISLFYPSPFLSHGIFLFLFSFSPWLLPGSHPSFLVCWLLTLSSPWWTFFAFFVGSSSIPVLSGRLLTAYFLFLVSFHVFLPIFPLPLSHGRINPAHLDPSVAPRGYVVEACTGAKRQLLPAFVCLIGKSITLIWINIASLIRIINSLFKLVSCSCFRSRSR